MIYQSLLYYVNKYAIIKCIKNKEVFGLIKSENKVYVIAVYQDGVRFTVAEFPIEDRMAAINTAMLLQRNNTDNKKKYVVGSNESDYNS